MNNQYWHPTAKDLDELEKHSRMALEEMLKTGDKGSWKLVVDGDKKRPESEDQATE